MLTSFRPLCKVSDTAAAVSKSKRQGQLHTLLLMLQDTWAEVQAENTEKAMLGTGKDYDRQFP